jgi:ABC-2 type transport system ATP-binding protein
MPPVIRLHHLVRHFGKTIAVDGLSFDVAQGEIFAMLGHNGAGKTTTVRLINGILSPTSGTLEVLGIDPSTRGPEVRRHTGVLTETPSLDERLSAWDNLGYYAAMHGMPRRDAARRVDELLATFDLTSRGQDRVAGFSRGMKQRLALARALLHRPELIFLDEPTSGLDPVATRQIHELILHLSRREGRTVFLCTHNLTEAQHLCDRVAVLQQGKLIALGAPSDLARQYTPRVQLRIQVDSEQLDRALAVVQLQHACTVQREPPALVVEEVAHDRIPDLVAALATAQVRIYRVEFDEPTLEDVYFALYRPTGGTQP